METEIGQPGREEKKKSESGETVMKEVSEAELARIRLARARAIDEERYKDDEPGGCICVDDEVYIWKGLRIMGLGGCIRYNREDTYQYTEKEMRRRARKLWFKAHRAGGIDLLLTHSPAAGLNDGNDRAHKGFACFNDLLEEYQPKWFVHGHVHLSYNANLPRVCTHGQTTVINATERYTFEIPDPDPVARKRFFWNDPAFPTKN